MSPPSRDELIEINHKNSRPTIISIYDIHHQSGFKSRAFIEMVKVL